jgi:hypothetical protein
MVSAIYGGFVYVRPQWSACKKLTVERIDGTIDDVTDLLISGFVDDGMNEEIGSFEFTIPNPSETYSNKWTGMEKVRYYKDYCQGVPTTLIFLGRIEKVSPVNENIKVTGRSEAMFIYDGKNVIKDYSAGVDAGYAIKDLFDTYGAGRYDTTAINVSTGITVTFMFNDVPFGDAIAAICEASGWDCFIPATLIVKFFLSGTLENRVDVIADDYNLMEVSDFAANQQPIKNKIRVMGGTVDGIQIIYTANDFASQSSSLGIRATTVSDDGIVTMDAAKAYGDFLLTQQKDAQLEGNVKAVLMATIQPGEMMRIVAPFDTVPPAKYRIKRYKDEWDENGDYTTATINKEARKVSSVLRDRIQREYHNTKASANPFDLDFAEIETFSTDTGLHSDTEIVDGVLKLQAGKSTGTWKSVALSTIDGNNVTDISIGISSNNPPGVSIEVSVDNELNWDVISRDQKLDEGYVGSSIVVKITLTGEATQLDSYTTQYSTSN